MASWPLVASHRPDWMSRRMAAWSRSEKSKRRFRSWAKAFFEEEEEDEDEALSRDEADVLREDALLPRRLRLLLAACFDALPPPKREERRKSLIFQPQPMTKSLLLVSLICAEVIDKVDTRAVLYSAFSVMLLLNVRLRPTRGEKVSLMETVEMSYTEEAV